MKHSLWLVILVTTVLGACKGCKKDTPPTYPITDKRLIDATSFKPGSYWIYVDSLSGEEDSFYCFFYQHKDDQFSQVHNAYFETNGYQMRGRSLGDGIGILTQQNSIGGGISLHYPNQFNGCYFVTLPFSPNTPLANSNNQIFFLNYYSNIMVRGNNYTDVYEVESRTSTDTVRTLYSMNSGLIKFYFKVGTERSIWLVKKMNLVR